MFPLLYRATLGCAGASELRDGIGRGLSTDEAIDALDSDAIVGSGPGSASLRKHILESHNPVEEVGRVAAEAGIRTLVLSHLVPAEEPPIADEVWRAGAKNTSAAESSWRGTGSRSEIFGIPVPELEMSSRRCSRKSFTVLASSRSRKSRPPNPVLQRARSAARHSRFCPPEIW